MVYYIALPFIYLISWLPLWLLYVVSDVLFFLLYHVFRYRRAVVLENLQNSFPEKSEIEIKRIERKFYSYFCDLTLETAKTLTIRPSSVNKMLDFKGLEVLKKYYDQKQSIIIALGHWGNWELAGARFATEPMQKLYVIYHPIHNKRMDKLVYHMRTRLGNGLYAMKDTLRGMVRNRHDVTATAFIADQTPSTKDALWMDFLDQDTPVFTGTGRIANKLKYPVVYAGVRRISRGRYTIEVEDLVTDPTSMEPEEIVRKFMLRLEKDIHEIPEIWLWTHRRWKHKRPT